MMTRMDFLHCRGSLVLLLAFGLTPLRAAAQRPEETLSHPPHSARRMISFRTLCPYRIVSAVCWQTTRTFSIHSSTNICLLNDYQRTGLRPLNEN